MTQLPPPPPPASFPPPLPTGYQPAAYAPVPHYQAPPTQYASWIVRVGKSMLASVGLAIPIQIVMTIPSNMMTSRAFTFGPEEQLEFSWRKFAPFLVLMLLTWIVGFIVQVRAYIQRAHLGYDAFDTIFHLRLVDGTSGMPLGSGWRVFGRSLLHILDALPCYTGFLAPLVSDKRQTFADMIMNTVVVSGGAPQPHKFWDLYLNSYKVWQPVIKA